MVQESVRNALRHAKAKTIAVVLQIDNQGLSIEVRDDGKGIDNEARTKSVGGLQNLRKRVDAFGGVLDFKDEPGGQGTTIHIELPREPPATQR